MITEINTSLKAIFENASEGFVLIDADLRIQTFNAKARESIFLNTQHKEIRTGSLIYEYLDASRIEALKPLLTRVLSGQPIEYDNAYLRKDGSKAWFHFSYWPVREENKVIAICISGTEITSRKVAEEMVILNERRFRALIENSQEMLTIFQPEGTVEYMSPEALRTFEYAPGTLPLSVFSLSPPEYIAETEKYFKQVLEKPGFPFKSRGIGRTSGGKTIWVEGTMTNMLHVPGIEAFVANFRNITGQKKLEDQEALLVSIVNSSDDAIFSTNLEGIITSWNPGAVQIMGYPAAQAIGKHISLLIPETLQEESRQMISQIKTGESIRQHETQRFTKQGQLIDVSISLAPIKDGTGIPIGVAAIVRDVSEMKRTQEALEESEGLYRSLFENSPLPKLVAQKSNLRFLKVNRMAIEHYGYSEKELLSMTAFDLRIREEHADLLRIMEEGSDKGINNKIVSHRKKNGDLIFVQVALDEIQYMGVPCYLVLINDLTDQLRLQKELSEERVKRQKEITKATIDGQEKQRAQIGKELHDNVNQLLASAKIYVSSMHSVNNREADLIERSLVSINACMNEIRKLSRSIVPPSLGDLGLAEAVDELVDNIQVGQPDTVFSTHLFLDEYRLAEGLKLSVYRIIQEQFSNIMKYADASQVALQLTQEGEALHLIIADNGKGFDTTQKRKGIGITNIINRAELYNGTVQIISSRGKGCTLRIKFDLSAVK